jgi:hypothetical protein
VDNYCFQFFTSLYISFGLKITVNLRCTEMIICPTQINYQSGHTELSAG